MARRRSKKRSKGFVPNNKTKFLVTGHSPTYLERLSRGLGAASQVARAVMPIVAAINTEHKYFDVDNVGVAYNPGTADSLFSLTSGIPQGLTDSTRIGNSLLSKDINVKMSLNWTPTATTGPLVSLARVIFFIWKENIQDNPPTVTKIFEVPATFLSPFNKDYTDQMVILKDKVINQNALMNVSIAQNNSNFKWFKKLDFHMRFDAAGTTDGTVNHLYCLVRGSNTLIANQVAYRLYSRMNYTDN